MIEVRSLTKRYGKTLAVDDLTFTVQPGVVTGFLGPNGSGKSTTMRMIVGLDRPTSGTVTVGGKAYEDAAAPIHEVGALLDAGAVQPGRNTINHLLTIGRTHGIGKRRVLDVLDLVGLESVAKRYPSTFSLGMGQRLGIATALLGDPKVVMLDEPVNGLDPEGIRWVRRIAKQLAAEGRTVFVSSHLLSEMALMAERVIVIGRGRLIADTTVDEFVAQASGTTVTVRTTRPAELAQQLTDASATVTTEGDRLQVRSLTLEEVAKIVADGGFMVLELCASQASLEDAFVEVTGGSVEYRTDDPNGTGSMKGKE